MDRAVIGLGGLLVVLSGCNSLLIRCSDDSSCPNGMWCYPTTGHCVAFQRPDAGSGDGGAPGPQPEVGGLTRVESGAGAGSMSVAGGHSIVHGSLAPSGQVRGPSHTLSGGIKP